MRTALVTGTNRGLGLEFVRQLAMLGYHVFAGVRDLENADALYGLQRTNQGRIFPLYLDITNSTTLHEAKEVISKQVNHLDILVNNAGANAKSKDFIQRYPECENIGFLTPQTLADMLYINAIGPLMVAQTFLSLLTRSKSGRVLNISSERGSITLKTTGGNYAYSASKAALNMYMKSFAVDALKVNVLSVLVHPGWVATDMGGSKALLTPTQAVTHLVKLIENATREDVASFFSPSGDCLPW